MGERVPSYVCYWHNSIKEAVNLSHVFSLLIAFFYCSDSIGRWESPVKTWYVRGLTKTDFFQNVPFSNLWNSSPSSFIPQGASSEEVDGTNKSAPTNRLLWNYRPFNWENLKEIIFPSADLAVPPHEPTTIVSAVIDFGCHFLLYF